LDYNLAPNYAGVPGYKAIFDSIEERVTFNTTTRFWPKMCRKLPHRSAVQIRGRIGKLFDAAILEGHAELAYSKVHQWSAQETEKLLRYYKIYGMSAWAMKHIGNHMKLPIHTCQNHLRSVLARTGPVPDHLRKKLWLVVTKQCSLRGDENFDRTVSKRIRKGRLENVNEYDHLIPWNIVAQRMVYSVELVQDAWHRLLRFLRSQCNNHRESGKSSKESWNIALKEVFDAVPAISSEDFSSFLHILSEATPYEAIYDACSKRLYDWQSIRSRLEEEGIVGFYAGGCEEHEYLFKKTRKVAHRAHGLLFRRLRLPYTLKERVHILSLAYDYQCGFSPRYCPDDDEDSVWNSDVPERYRFRNPCRKNHGFPALSRRALVEALIVYSLSHFDDWIPPTALKRYVKSTDILSMFLKRKDNSELIKQKDIDIAISFLDLDVGSETSSSDSKTESSSGFESHSDEENNEKASFGTKSSRKRRSLDEESDKCSDRAFSKRKMSNADSGDRTLDGASAKMPETSRHRATAASSNSLKSQGLDVSVKKKRRKDETTVRDSISATHGPSRNPTTGDTVKGSNQLDSSGIEILDVRKATDYSFKPADPARLIESQGIVGYLNAFPPRKKKT
uniref:HTH myb-type domain-containing protein n=1 Tax=Haemonchus placei TaxID=6290 RepID=A0A0N4WDU9_HAEPC